MIFTGSAHPALAEEIARCLKTKLSGCDRFTFRNGERYVRFTQNVRGADVFLIQTCFHPINDHIMELLLMIDAAKRASAANITAVVPFYGYSRQDRKAKGREPISAKLVADLYQAAGLHRLITVDLHNPSIQGFFDLPVDHVTAIPILAEYLKKRKFGSGVVVGPDVGGLRRASLLAERMSWPLAVLNKNRTNPREQTVEIQNLVGEVKDRTAVILDDMIDSGGTLIKSADFLKKEGARRVIAAATHPILTDQAEERFHRSVIEEVVVTDTLPHSTLPDKFKQLTVAPLLAETIRRVFSCQSVSALFKMKNPPC